MAYTDNTWTAVLVTVANMNAWVRDNFRFFYAGVGFLATKSAQVVAGTGSPVKLQPNTEVWDSDGFYDNATNFRFQPTIAGKYEIKASISMTNVNGSCLLNIYQNGSATSAGASVEFSTSQSGNLSCSGIFDFNGSTDYVEVFGFHNTGSNRNFDVRFSGFRVGT
jgi:hypothetical protein